MKNQNSNNQQNEAMPYDALLAPVTSDLYRTFNKETGEWINECVCRNCAIKLADNPKSDIGVNYDSYATYNFSHGENGSDDIEFETCPICSDEIPRGEKNGNYNFVVPDNIRAN